MNIPAEVVESIQKCLVAAMQRTDTMSEAMALVAFHVIAEGDNQRMTHEEVKMRIAAVGRVAGRMMGTVA